MTGNRLAGRSLWRVTLASVALVAVQARAATLGELLAAAPQPVFKAGHTLVPLARWGWSMPLDVRIGLCEHWGYALEFGGYLTEKAVAELDDPENANAKLIALTASDPGKYPLAVLTHRPLGGNSELPPELRRDLYVRGAKGEPILDDGKTNTWRLISPEAPDAIFKWAAAGTVGPLSKLRKKVPIALVLNGGEYGLAVFGHSGRYWEQDPRVVAAKGERSWFDYLSASKARQEGFIANAVRQAIPGATYIWYHFAGEPAWTDWKWTHDFAHTRKLTDYPSQSLYYRHFNDGWTGKNDLLSNFLVSVSQATERFDAPLSYNWVAGGWKTNAISPVATYTGFLKCLYTAGMIGGVAGFFSRPAGANGQDIGKGPSDCLDQMLALGHVHALFSHLEEFLRHGRLLAGPLKLTHPNADGLPGYELPSGDPEVRVLVRKHEKHALWLATAWAAGGAAREVTVEVAELGEVRLNARPEGSVYLLRIAAATDYEPPAVGAILIDRDGLQPSITATEALKGSPLCQ
jgi:hypothetical protein